MNCRNVWFSFWIGVLFLTITQLVFVEAGSSAVKGQWHEPVKSNLEFIAEHWYQPWCFVVECCTKKWILQDYEGVKRSLSDYVFGQHLVQDVVYSSLKGHVLFQPNKPLVLSFHGSTGTGKTFVSKWIANSWFRKGMKSKFVHFFSSTKDFPHEYKFAKYVDFLKREISSSTRSCGHQIFIFDEVDSLPDGLLQSLRSFLEYQDSVDGVDYRNTIFIFLSNIGDDELEKIAGNVYKNNGKRENIQLAETEGALTKSVFKGKTHRRLINKDLISHLVPFFPLERRHVKKCITEELEKRHTRRHSTFVNDVMEELQFKDPDNNFSEKGCKNVAEKLNYVLASWYTKSRQDL